MIVNIEDRLITGGHLHRVAAQVAATIRNAQTDGGDRLIEIRGRDDGTPSTTGVEVVYYGDVERYASVRPDATADEFDEDRQLTDTTLYPLRPIGLCVSGM